MSEFFFFTQQDVLSQNQTDTLAFGPVPSSPLEYRVNNQFLVSADAPAFAVVDGIPLVQQCENDPNCINIVLYPFKTPDFNFPNIKLFVYRGIRKDSIINTTTGEIFQADSTWKTDNILTTLYHLQNKINQDAGTSEVPKAENLGYHYSDSNDIDNFKPDTEFVETIVFLNDGLQLPLVKAGCQLGKFIGGGGTGTPAGFQIILDRVGYEPTLGWVRSEDDVVTVNNLTANPTAVQTFQHWHEKEQILTYLDPAALYGCAQANGHKIKVYQNDADDSGTKMDASSAVSLFHNKNCCYIDIRNDFNYSFNYYSQYVNSLELGFEQSGTEDFLVSSVDYYANWPLLRLFAQSVPAGSKSRILIKLPIHDVAGYNARYFLRSYTHKFLEKAEWTFFQELNYLDPAGAVRKDFCEEFFVEAWVSDDDFLGANYFSFKYGKVQISEITEDILFRRNQYDLVFPLELKNLIGDEILDDGDFKVSLYSSENAPILLKNFLDDSDEYYTQYLGIAKDKNNTTFFSFPDRIGYESGRRLKFPFAIIQQGKYENSAFLNEFEYDSNTEELGFLSVLPKRTLDSALVLKKVSQQFEGQLEKFLYYLNTRPTEDNKFSIDAKKFHAITIANEEYDTIMGLVDTEFGVGYKVFLQMDNDTLATQNHDGFAIGTSNLKLKGIAFNTIDDKVEVKEVLVEHATTQETTQLNFYVNKI